MINKYIMSVCHFNSPILFTSYHFIMTYLILEIMCRMGLIERGGSKIPEYAKWELAAFSVGGVLFMNFNLKVNSVGFYQLSKLCCIPVIVIYSYFFLKKNTPLPIILSLLVLLVGISMFTVNEISMSLSGSIVAIIAVILVAIQQTKMGTSQKEYSVNGPTMQHSTALKQFVICFIAGLLMETHGKNSIFTHKFKPLEVFLIILTGFISCGVNVCAFGLIGKTSPVTYQVVGHVKTILIFIFGLIIFPANPNETREMFIKKIVGLIVSMSGVIYYTYLNLREKTKQEHVNNEDSKYLLSNNEEEEEILK